LGWESSRCWRPDASQHVSLRNRVVVTWRCFILTHSFTLAQAALSLYQRTEVWRIGWPSNRER
jgi:hypothetical protein